MLTKGTHFPVDQPLQRSGRQHRTQGLRRLIAELPTESLHPFAQTSRQQPVGLNFVRGICTTQGQDA